jgi:hypothetical protein
MTRIASVSCRAKTQRDFTRHCYGADFREFLERLLTTIVVTSAEPGFIRVILEPRF